MTAPAVRIGPRTAVVLVLASVVGLMMFLWPLVLQPSPGERVDPPFIFLALLPLVIAVVLADITEGGIDSKALAMLGVLTAVNGAMRALGAGTAGIELVFFLLILSGRVFGAGFGFVLGCTSLFASALLTSGVGPWLPFQMLASAWIGMGAGLLPRRLTGRLEIAVLAAYGVVAAYAYGLLLNLWSWPFALGIVVEGRGSTLWYVPGEAIAENLHRFLVYSLLTSTGGWDTGRAVTNAVAIIILGPAILVTLRRAARRASFASVADHGRASAGDC